MSFPLVMSPVDARRVAAGRKTQLRRLAVRDGLTGRMRHSSTMEPGATFEVAARAVGDVEQRDVEPVATIVVLAVRSQLLADVTFEEARAEGWRTRAEFADHWMATHDRRWPLLEERPCPTCDAMGDVDGERCPAGCDELGLLWEPAELDDDQVWEIFTATHGRRLVRVIEFALEERRFLHRRSDALYTSDPREALPGESEAVDRQTLERLAMQGRKRFSEGLRKGIADAAELGLEELRKLAAAQGVDVREYRRAEQRRLERAREREAASLERKLRDRADRRAA